MILKGNIKQVGYNFVEGKHERLIAVVVVALFERVRLDDNFEIACLKAASGVRTK